MREVDAKQKFYNTPVNGAFLTRSEEVPLFCKFEMNRNLLFIHHTQFVPLYAAAILYFLFACAYPFLSASISPYWLFISIPIISAIFLLLVMIEFKNAFLIIISGYLLRIFAWYCDLFTSFPVLFSGGDSEVFWEDALSFSEGIFSDIHTGYYPWIMGSFMYIFNAPRTYVQFGNVLLGSFSLLVLWRLLMMLHVQHALWYLSILAFMPITICNSGILLREAWIQFFSLLGIYLYINYIYSDRKRYWGYSCVSVILASILHVAQFCIIIGGIVNNFISQKGCRKFIALFISAILLGSMLIFYSDVFLIKFKNMNSIDNAIISVNYKNDYAGSQYLANLYIDSPQELLLYAPLKVFYFMYSPFTHLTQLSNLSAFLLDSCVYICLSLGILCNLRKILRDDKMRYLLFTIIFAYFLLAWGTMTSGTAMRHRNKMLPAMILLAGAAKNRASHVHIGNQEML